GGDGRGARERARAHAVAVVLADPRVVLAPGGLLRADLPGLAGGDRRRSGRGDRAVLVGARAADGAARGAPRRRTRTGAGRRRGAGGRARDGRRAGGRGLGGGGRGRRT